MILLTVALVLLGGTAGAVVWLPRVLHDPTIDQRVMRAVERDPGFGATPPDAAQLSSGRRLECTDASGRPPKTFRELSVPWPDKQVLQFYRNELASHGWITASSTAPISGEAFTKMIAERTIQLDVYTGIDNDNFTLALGFTRLRAAFT